MPCIMITGRVFPDLATRALTHFLSVTLRLPVLGLCDWNPYGMALLMTYILGSLASGLEVGFAKVDSQDISLLCEDDMDRTSLS